jgi:hypothetical protein
VEFNAFECMFCKDTLAHLRHRTFREMERVFSVNILCDIDICFTALVYMNYLVFLQRLKHGGLWHDLFLPERRHHLLFRHLRLRRENRALGLHKRLARGGLHTPLVLEVVGEGP